MSQLGMRWPKYWNFSLSISPFNEHPGWVSFRMDPAYLYGSGKVILDFTGDPAVKNLPANAGDTGSALGRKTPHATEQIGLPR